MIVLITIYNFKTTKKRNCNTTKNNINRDYFKNLNNSDGPLPLPGNHENEIVEAILSEDPLFNTQGILSYTKYIFCRLQKAITEGDLSSIRQILQDDFYENQQNQLINFQKYGYSLNSEVIQIQRMYLQLYQRDAEEEILTLFATADMRQYTVDKNDMEIVDGDEEDILHFHYLITLMRKRSIKTAAINKDIAYSQCSSSYDLTEKVEYDHFTDGYSGWVINSITRIFDFSKIDERGVVFY